MAKKMYIKGEASSILRKKEYIFRRCDQKWFKTWSILNAVTSEKTKQVRRHCKHKDSMCKIRIKFIETSVI